jgi:hypothetical protein
VLRATATANSTHPSRSGLVTVTAGSQSATFTVTQPGTDDHGNTPGTATVWDVASNRSITGVLETGPDLDVFRVVAPVSGTYTFRSTKDQGDVYGSLLDANGNVIAQNDDGGGNLNFLITYALTAGQTYYVQIRNYNQSYPTPVAYTLTATLP